MLPIEPGQARRQNLAIVRLPGCSTDCIGAGRPTGLQLRRNTGPTTQAPPHSTGPCASAVLADGASLPPTTRSRRRSGPQAAAAARRAAAATRERRSNSGSKDGATAGRKTEQQRVAGSSMFGPHPRYSRAVMPKRQSAAAPGARGIGQRARRRRAPKRRAMGPGVGVCRPKLDSASRLPAPRLRPSAPRLRSPSGGAARSTPSLSTSSALIRQRLSRPAGNCHPLAANRGDS